MCASVWQCGEVRCVLVLCECARMCVSVSMWVFAGVRYARRNELPLNIRIENQRNAS